MFETIKFSDDQIKQFIPQREPMLMVNRMYDCTEDSVQTGLVIKQENIFVDENGNFSEAGVIEHIAQSAAVFAGYNDFINGRPVVLGYIAEIKGFSNPVCVMANQEILSSLKVVSYAMNITLMQATSYVNGTEVASCKIKIFMDK